MHTYPLWERKDIDEGLSYTIERSRGSSCSQSWKSSRSTTQREVYVITSYSIHYTKLYEWVSSGTA